MEGSTLHEATRSVPRYTHGSVEDIRRKKRGNASRAVKRHRAKRAVPHGHYVVKASTINKHVRPAAPIQTQLDAEDLPHTRNAYTGWRDTDGHGKVYTLEELVGEGSEFGFKLERWDGR